MNDPAFRARALVRLRNNAALGTVMADGSPLVTLIALATAPDGTPLLLLSRIAGHTQNIARDPRVSLLICDDGGLGDPPEDPMTGARLSLTGEAVLVEPQDTLAAKTRFIARHPASAPYDTDLDFCYFRVQLTQGRFNQGFGSFQKLGPSELLIAGPEELAHAEKAIVSHMNEDHGAAIDHYACGVLGRSGGGWRMTGIDAEGADLARGGEYTRLSFPSPVSTPQEARNALIALAKR